jgi:hypothetical protein
MSSDASARGIVILTASAKPAPHSLVGINGQNNTGKTSWPQMTRALFNVMTGKGQ